MHDIKFVPVGRVYLTPSQKREQHIKRLEQGVAILMGIDIAWTTLAFVLLWMVAK